MPHHNTVNKTDLTKAPNLLKLWASLLYETLAVIALCLVCAWAFVMLFGEATHGVKRGLLQLFLWLSVGVYFVWCWRKGGQTLAMQTWQLKVVNHESTLLTVHIAIARYVLSCMSLMLFGFGFLWAIVDRDHLFLHDRLLKTHIICVPRNTA
ncbi:MAG: RDD family protein [Methylotenera sp.]|nr:RDD family protein [Methylotenera sp.]MSP99563.1 RDD family protein [Methylotenera sp.]